MGMNVEEVDIEERKIDIERRIGEKVKVKDKKVEEKEEYIRKEKDGGEKGVMVKEVQKKDFEKEMGMVERGGNVQMNGMKNGDLKI